MSDFFSIVRKLTKKSVTESEISTQIDVQLKDYMKGVKGIDYEFVAGGMQIVKQRVLPFVLFELLAERIAYEIFIFKFYVYKVAKMQKDLCPKSSTSILR